MGNLKIKNRYLKNGILCILGVLILSAVIIPIVQTNIFERDFEEDRTSGWIKYELFERSDKFNVIRFDDLGRAWIGSNQGASVLVDDTWHTYNQENSGIPAGSVFDIEIAPDGNIWIASEWGVGQYDGKVWQSFLDGGSGLTGEIFTNLEIDNSGNILVGTHGGGVFLLTEGTWQSFRTGNSGIVGDVVWDIEFDDLGRIWIGSGYGLTGLGDEGVSVFDGENWHTYTSENSSLPHGIIYDIEFDHTGNAWVGTDGAVCKFAGEDWQCYTEDDTGIHMMEAVYYIGFDNLGNPWIATHEGISILIGDTWTTHYSTGFRGGAIGVNCVFVDPEGRIIFANDDSLNIIQDDKKIQYSWEDSGFRTSEPNDIAVDSDGNIWIVGSRGVNIAFVDETGLPHKTSLDQKYEFENSIYNFNNQIAHSIALILFWIWLFILREDHLFLLPLVVHGLYLLMFFSFSISFTFVLFTQIGGILGMIIGDSVRKRKKVLSQKPKIIGFIIGSLVISFVNLVIFALAMAFCC